MKFRLRRLFGIDDSGRSALPNSRRQLLIGGIVCLLIWPGIGMLLLASDVLDASERIYAFVSPFLVVTALGVYLLIQSMLTSTHPTHTDNLKDKEKK